MVLGLGLIGLGLWNHGGAAPYALAGGMAGTLLGALYLVSPAWKIEVQVHEHGLEVLSRGDRRFLLPWDEVVRLVAAPSTRTCFVDGGRPDRSLLIPGPGASAPYDITDKAALYEAIVARVPAERRVEVASLEAVHRGTEPQTGTEAGAGAGADSGAEAGADSGAEAGAEADSGADAGPAPAKRTQDGQP